MPPHRANTRNANTAPLVQDEELSKVKFRNVIQMLVQSVSNQNNHGVNAHVYLNSGSMQQGSMNFL